MSESIVERDIIIEHLERFRGVTLQTLDLVPDDQLNWKPVEGMRSFAEGFLHIAQVEEFYSSGILGGAWSFEVMQMPDIPLTKDLLKLRLSQSRSGTLANLRKIDLPALDEIVSVPHIPTQWPAKSWLWYLVEHEVHHKAQLALYLRLIEAVPPFFAFVLPQGVRPDVR